MFVQDFEVVDIAFEQAATSVSADARGLLDTAFLDARTAADHPRAGTGPEGWPSLFSEQVDVRFSPVRFFAGRLVLSFRWTAGERSSLVPTLEGEIVFAPLADGRTEVVFRGQHETDAAPLVPDQDRLLLQRTAESMARAFLRGIASGLTGADEGPGLPRATGGA